MIKKFCVSITADDIYNKITPEQKEQFTRVKITNIRLWKNDAVDIECIALDEEINECNTIQKLIGDWNISVI